MFDSIGAFTRQFKPVDGGYLYYPSKGSGGKLVTAEEFEALAADWRRVAGRGGIWKAAGIIFLAILVWTVLSEAGLLPAWTEAVMVGAVITGLVGWLLWAGLAPIRLVRGRPDIVPPRPISQVRREVRAMLNWPFMIFALLLTGVLFIGALSSMTGTLAGWAWVIGSGFLFGLYLWAALQKFRDQKN